MDFSIKRVRAVKMSEGSKREKLYKKGEINHAKWNIQRTT